MLRVARCVRSVLPARTRGAVGFDVVGIAWYLNLCTVHHMARQYTAVSTVSTAIPNSYCVLLLGCSSTCTCTVYYMYTTT